jgi:hypothetical protein
LLAGTRGHGADYLNAGIALGEQKRASAILPAETRMQKLEHNKIKLPKAACVRLEKEPQVTILEV